MVVNAFLEGNPDWPIIVGSVYNNEQMPPYLGDGPDSKHAKDNKVTGVKSNSTPDGQGFNEWRFDDTKGKEQIFIHAQYNMDTRVLNDSMTRVFGNSHAIVGWEKDGKKGGDQKEKVYQDKHLHVMRHQREQVEGNRWLTVGYGGRRWRRRRSTSLPSKRNNQNSIEGGSDLHVKGVQTGSLMDKAQSKVTVKDAEFKSVGRPGRPHHGCYRKPRRKSRRATKTLNVGGQNAGQKVSANGPCPVE